MFDEFVILEPTKTLKSFEAVKIITKRIIIPFGCNKLKSDLGSPFISKILEDLAQIFKYQLSFTTSYRPESNGKIERVHGPIGTMILVEQLITELATTQNGFKWNLMLPFIEGILNDIKHEKKSGYSANTIRYGPNVVRSSIEWQWQINQLDPNLYVKNGKIECMG